MDMTVVVGDRLSTFANEAGAITTSEFLRKARLGEIQSTVIMGQGISADIMDQIMWHSSRCGLSAINMVDASQRADRKVTHKEKSGNGLISHPEKNQEGVFESKLLIDGNNELILDHNTGCHIQGMVLIEAIRQMFIAVAETQYQDLNVPQNGYVVFDSLDVRFENFAFPVDAVVRYTTLSIEPKGKKRIRFVADIEIFQNDVRVASSKVAYTVYEQSFLEPIEHSQAKKALSEFTARAHKRHLDEESYDHLNANLRAVGQNYDE